MADDTDLAKAAESGNPASSAGKAPRASRRRAGLAAAGMLIAAGTGLWLARGPIAQSLIDRQLGQLGLPAHYTIESIGTDAQVLTRIVIGDPAHPDLTIARAEVRLVYSLTGPRIGRITLEQPRLYGTYHGGKLSFGSLDPLLFPEAKSTAPFSLPDIDLKIVDGRALVESDYGRLAVKAEGAGNLSGGFAGTPAALAPTPQAAGCAAEKLSAFGKVSVEAGRPRFAGPVRLANLACGKDMALHDAALALDLTGDKDLAGAVIKGRMASSLLTAPGVSAQTLALGGELALKAGALRGHVLGDAGGVRTAGLTAAALGLDGDLDAHAGLANLVFRGAVSGKGLARGAATERALAQAQGAAAGTLVAPLLARLRAALGREERGSRLAGDVMLRREPGRWSLVVPTAAVRGGSGAALLSVSRLQVAGEGISLPRLTGNFVMAGEGLPPITGRMEPVQGGRPALRLRMAEYRAGADSAALPLLEIAQSSNGALVFTGTAQVSGAIPGGAVTALKMPISGSLSPRGDLALWTQCINPQFDSLQLGQLTLDRRQLTLCPAGGQAIVRSSARGLSVALGTSAFVLTGKLGATALTLSTGAVGLAWPGTLTARSVDVALGPGDAPTRLRLGNLVAHLGKDFAGTFDGVEARLAAVPVDVTGAAGAWRYGGDTLTLSGVRFAATDRFTPARFEKLTSDNAVLTLKGNRIEASALLREPESGRDVARMTMRHDLASTSGHADLAVDGLVFDEGKIRPGKVGGLQPKTLASQFQGVIADAKGTVRGSGRVDWTADTVTSSGTFGSDGLDFAAAFGPVRGVSGDLVFTDLIGMVTAPHQTLRVASANPGIEVTGGVIDLELLAGQVVRLNSAVWPFLGGTLRLAPTNLRLTEAEARRFTLQISGLDAAQFLGRMELANLSATGTFDGQLPLEFDANGGRIVGGTLVSRPPGGTVSYVGALSYKDLSQMANFAFDALKSLDYTTMTIGMNGDLAGEVITNVAFDGIKQGKGTKQNFVTRQVANLPLKFNINVRAPFYRLISSMNPQPPPGVLPPTIPQSTLQEPASGVQPLVSAPTP
ncbi:MAG: YdbH domain-containing protein [Novosphingobium sp.]